MFVGAPLPLLGIDVAQVTCFLAFWAFQVFFIVRGMESIRWLETLAGNPGCTRAAGHLPEHVVLGLCEC